MTLKRQSICDQIEVLRDGTIQVRTALVIVDVNTVISLKWHRIELPPGSDISGQFDVVNAHLSSLGEAAISDADIAKIKSVATSAWTPEVVAAYQAALSSAQAALQPSPVQPAS